MRYRIVSEFWEDAAAVGRMAARHRLLFWLWLPVRWIMLLAAYGGLVVATMTFVAAPPWGYYLTVGSTFSPCAFACFLPFFLYGLFGLGAAMLQTRRSMTRGELKLEELIIVTAGAFLLPLAIVGIILCFF